MHFHAEIYFREKPKNIESAVAEVMEPHKNDLWDWYQIGGRWAGCHITDTWASEWERIDEELASLKSVPIDITAYALFVGDSVYVEEEWNGADWVKTDYDGRVLAKLAELGIANGYLVTIDYHN